MTRIRLLGTLLALLLPAALARGAEPIPAGYGRLADGKLFLIPAGLPGYVRPDPAPIAAPFVGNCRGAGCKCTTTGEDGQGYYVCPGQVHGRGCPCAANPGLAVAQPSAPVVLPAGFVAPQRMPAAPPNCPNGKCPYAR